MWELLGKMIEDPDESWWVVQEALFALARASDAEIIAKHKDRLFHLVETRPCTWTKVNALLCLAKVSAHPKHYKDTLARTLDASTRVWNKSASYRFNRVLREALSKAAPKIKEYASPLVQKTYADIPPKLVARSGAVFGGGSESMKTRIAEVLGSLPGGAEFVRTLPKATLASARSGNPGDMFEFKTFKPDPQFVGRWKLLGKCYTHPPADKEMIGVLNHYTKREDAAKANPKTGRNAFRPNYLVLDGTYPPKKGSTFWSHNVVIDNTRGEALGMALRTVDGKKFLLVEVGGFPDDAGRDYHNAHNHYIQEL